MAKFPGDKRKKRLRQYRARERAKAKRIGGIEGYLWAAWKGINRDMKAMFTPLLQQIQRAGSRPAAPRNDAGLSETTSAGAS